MNFRKRLIGHSGRKAASICLRPRARFLLIPILFFWRTCFSEFVWSEHFQNKTMEEKAWVNGDDRPKSLAWFEAFSHGQTWPMYKATRSLSVFPLSAFISPSCSFDQCWKKNPVLVSSRAKPRINELSNVGTHRVLQKVVIKANGRPQGTGSKQFRVSLGF